MKLVRTISTTVRQCGTCKGLFPPHEVNPAPIPLVSEAFTCRDRAISYRSCVKGHHETGIVLKLSSATSESVANIDVFMIVRMCNI
ncbi:hypothetical protein Bpfe_022469 [Biomphalaria pfeifferi]|uniref:Uncharacterized protein n=1 Tax=Biomphalaria pfeifferi TaxID=112525 RepID=A0AAD8B5A7_BIOPF|nr:hypothetical protein Bpfe_022469 [Biomphalaria pfeifferi]